MRKVINILEDYKTHKNERKISAKQKRIIEKAVKKAVDEYGEVYKRLATE